MTTARLPAWPAMVMMLAAGLLAWGAAAGCGPASSRKPELYQVRGRVIDVETGQGLAHARVLLRAAIQGGLGTQVLSAYAVAGADGTYSVELSEVYETVRYATRIRVDASKPGYASNGMEVPSPSRKQAVYGLPDIALGQPGSPTPSGPAVPAVPEPAQPREVLPWK
ncbi:MAG TPA: hypothetical protein VM431_15160 [Phycisphaerae bacterium]|nr:hypothetical protein [Phycisphaerae bacterium]